MSRYEIWYEPPQCSVCGEDLEEEEDKNICTSCLRDREERRVTEARNRMHKARARKREEEGCSFLIGRRPDGRIIKREISKREQDEINKLQEELKKGSQS